MSSLVSLDLAGTHVTDLTPLAGLRSLRELNVACLSVDLTPLQGLSLIKIVVAGPGHVVVPKEMQRRVVFSTGYSEVESP
ncbi:MAG: hypothetical protein IH991_16785 [Planctomycetes bacterium]|nr:hypothetical protein [Planctomycetota bacterium]